MNKNEEKYTKVFENLCKVVKWPCWRSTRDENMHKHFDCTITAPENGTDGKVQDLKIELKGDKYTSRGRHGNPEHLCQYIEYKNVKGNIGWLFGDAHYVAILNEKLNGFYFIRLEALLAYSEKLFGVKMKDRKWEDIISDLNAKREHWTFGSAKHHKLYSRKQFKKDDLVTQITMEEVKKLASFELKYFEKTN